MVAFPTNINYLDAASFEVEVENTSLTPAKMEGGYVITRPRHTRRPRRTFSWRYTEMRDADKAALLAFWDQMKGGSQMFQWTHPISGETIDCRFGEFSLKFKRIGFGPLNVWETDTITIVEV